MTDTNYEMIGRFIYGAHRNGGDTTDIANWMADDLGLARPDAGDDFSQYSLYGAFFAKYDDEQLQENLARFLAQLKSRRE